MKSMVMQIGNRGAIRVEWDDTVGDLDVKLAFATVLRTNLARLDNVDVGYAVDGERLPTAANVVDFANTKRPG